MKTENLKKLAEVIIDEADYTPSIKEYYKVLDYEDAEKLDDMFYELDETIFDDEWYCPPSCEFLDIWAGEFAKVKEEHKPTEFHFENGKQIVHKYEEEYWTPFIEEHKESIESVVWYYAEHHEQFDNNLLEIFKDYIDLKKVAEGICNDCGLDEDEVLEQIKNGEAIY